MTGTVPCTWSEEAEDDCLMCSGEACALCGAGTQGGTPEVPCEHDAEQRHEVGP